MVSDMMTGNKLIGAVLQLAMQGKIVDQRPEEGTGEELYQKIKLEKDRLIKRGVLKKSKKNEEISDDEKPFDIPESWKWVRVEDIAILNPKNDLDDDTDTSFIPMTLVDDAFSNHHTSERRKWGEIKKGFSHFAEGDIGVAKITPCFQNRKSVIFKDLINGYGAGTTELSIVRPIKKYSNSKYLLFIFKSELFINNGVKSFTGTAGQQRIHKDYLRRFVIPLPPLAEQTRIVAKIEKLMPFVKQYAAASTKLNTLNASFPEMMKKSILQEAVKGKLVPQDPNDEPASVLLKKIAEEKKRLINEGKIKKQKPLPEITEEEIPFDIPESWEWCYVGDLFDHNTGKAMNSSAKQVNKKGSVRKFITTSNLYWNRFDLSSIKEMFFSDDELARCTATKRDILMCEGGAYFGRTAIWNYDYDICFQNHVHRLRPYVKIKEEFFYYLFYFYRTTGLMKSKGTAMPGLSSVALHSLVIPLPPLTEQERIVSKIEELLPCVEKISR